MKSLELNKYGVQEMNAEEMCYVDGGTPSYYFDGGLVRAVIDGFDCVCGFANGFFGFK
jgi:hypothetical protein